MHNKVVSIVRIFPDFEEKIDFLFQTDENFRDLCSDYILCASRILDLKTALNKDHSMIKEYEELQKQLEDDILKMILSEQ